MPTPTAPIKIISLFITICLFYACSNNSSAPLPTESEYPQPATTAIEFGPEEKLSLPEAGLDLTYTPSRFGYEKLPVSAFDTLGFRPLNMPAEITSIDLDKLPSINFQYDSLPEISLHFKISRLSPPEKIKIPRPALKNTKSEFIYDFPEPLNGVDITAMYKSKDGYTWVGTQEGLFRFDGENLLRYPVNGLATQIQFITEDRNNKIWIGTSGRGLFVMDVAKGISRNLSTAQGLISNFSVRGMLDKENRMWVTFLPSQFNVLSPITGGSVAIIDEQKQTVRFLQQKNGLSANSPATLAIDSTGNIWVTTAQAGITLIDLKNNRIKHIGKAQGLSSDTLTIIHYDNKNCIWVSGFYGQLNKIDLEKGTITKLDERHGLIRAFIGSIVLDKQGFIWLGGNRRATCIDPALEYLKKIDHSTGLITDDASLLLEDAGNQILVGTSGGLNMLRKNGLDIYRAGNAQISSLLEDSHGRIWIGTLENGIQILEPKSGIIKTYDRAHGLSDNLVQYLVEFNGNILLSTQRGGIEIIDTSLNKIERIDGANGLTDNLTTIEKDQQNNIWIGGLGKGLKVLDIINRKLRSIGSAEGFKDTAVIDIKLDRKGQLWFYSWSNGVGKINLTNKTIRHVVRSEYKSLTGSGEDNLLMHDSKGNTWVVTANGFYMINASSDSVTRFSTVEGLLPGQGVALREYKGRILAGTLRGLNIITPPDLTPDKKWKIQSLGRSNGIVKKVGSYNADLVRSNGEYWWGDDGITIIKNLEEYLGDTPAPEVSITGFDVFNRPQYFSKNPVADLSEKDTLWNVDGKNDTVRYNRNDASKFVKWKNDGIEWDSLTPGNNLPLNPRIHYNKNYLQFHYAQMHLAAQDTVWFSYMLEGIDQNWSNKTQKTFSENYPKIGYGHYTFKVSALYKGKWSKPAVYSFTITPPWWRTWWAWILYVLAGLGILGVYISYRSGRLKKENKLLEEKVNHRTIQLQKSLEELKATQSQLVQSEKMASLGELTAGIAHEIQNPLNFINNFSEVNNELIDELKTQKEKLRPEDVEDLLKDIFQNNEKINHHGRRADAIVKSMLQHSRSTSNAVKEPTDINTLADEYLRLAYHGLRAKEKTFNATLNTDYDQTIGRINIIPQDIGRVILNLINNAFYAVSRTATGQLEKDSGTRTYEPTVWISTKKSAGHVSISVRDNGHGIPQKVLDKIFQPFFTTKSAGQGTGLGLSLAYDIVKAHGGELKVDTKENEGTTFTILLPINSK